MEQFSYKTYKPYIVNELEKPSHEKRFYFCPLCGSGHKKNGTPAFVINPNYSGHCYACGFTGDIIDLIMRRDCITASEARQIVIDKYGHGSVVVLPHNDTQIQKHVPVLPKKDYTRYIKWCASRYTNSPAESYVKTRGFTDEIARTYSFGYCYHAIFGDVLVIPYPNENYYCMRILKPMPTINGEEQRKYHKPKSTEAGKEPIFNKTALDADRVFIVESQLDALSIIQVGGNACAIGGSGYYEKFKGVSIHGEVIIFADNDDAGINTAKRIRAIVKNQTGQTARIIHAVGAGCKDVNELLVKEPETLRDMIANPQKEKYRMGA